MSEQGPVTTSPEEASPQAEPVGHAGTRVRVTERKAWAVSGGVGLLVVLACVVLALLAYANLGTVAVAVVVVLVLVAVVVLGSLVVVQPGETRVVQFFGRYVGTVRRTGLSWVAPLTTRQRVSVRVRNFETSRLKVNDAEGNPVEIAAIVVWQVADTAQAVYAVDDYLGFVQVQAESALRHVANVHPYDGDGVTLRGATEDVAAELAEEVAQRIQLAGVEIVEVRISHLAYAAEIAQAMLQRQQATAVVAARERIVDGAVGMVEMALGRLSERGIVELDEERKAAMVGNLMVVLCGDNRATPIVNTGSLYT